MLSNMSEVTPYWGIAIAGLAMNAQELPSIPGLYRVNNPEVGDGMQLGHFYQLEEVAKIHAEVIARLPKASGTFTVMGMSMGGMIGSILATKFRDLLPEQCEFRLMVTTANEAPALAMSAPFLIGNARMALQTEWALRPFVERLFSESFAKRYPDKIIEYTRYHARRKNQQSRLGFLRQLHAIRTFKGGQYFSKLAPECTLIHGGGDRLVTKPHADILRTIAPHVKHVVLDGVGHMINFESPQAFSQSV